MASLTGIFDLVLQVLFLLLYLLAAAVTFFRFRTTLTGIFLGGALGLLGIKGSIMAVVFRFLLKGRAVDDVPRFFIQIGSQAMTVLLIGLIVVGLALIPRSLDQLARSKTER